MNEKQAAIAAIIKQHKSATVKQAGWERLLELLKRVPGMAKRFGQGFGAGTYRPMGFQPFGEKLTGRFDKALGITDNLMDNSRAAFGGAMAGMAAAPVAGAAGIAALPTLMHKQNEAYQAGFQQKLAEYGITVQE